MFSHPEALQTILTNDDAPGNDKAQLFDAPGDLNVLFEPFLGKESVIGLSGDRHQRMRKLMMPPFHGERMRSYGQLIVEITATTIAKWKEGETFSVRPSMQAITMQAILGAVFGLSDGPRFRELETLLGTMLDDMSNPFSVSLLYFPILRQDLGPWSPWGRFLRKRDRIDRIVYFRPTHKLISLNALTYD